MLDILFDLLYESDALNLADIHINVRMMDFRLEGTMGVHLNSMLPFGE